MSYHGEYKVKREGVNSQGNYYCARDYGRKAKNQNCYYYCNADMSEYYSNPDGSQYFDNGRGTETYTTPDGTKYVSRHGAPWERLPEN
ncbi:hypothetical protein GGR55DRAFT_647701 [Xylaria sp. FL0064]|nr:hypothetical protein GGR55DRAFT_647701 [Xylaria sp. FL0064]